MSRHSEKAREMFLRGYSCAQSVFAAFCDVTGMDEETALKLSSSFGGGMARMREVCGACSACFMVLGLLYGYAEPDYERKKEHYALIQRAAARFKEQNGGTMLCRELLKNVATLPGTEPEKRTEQYYKVRPCVRFVECAAQIIDELTEELSDKQ